MSTHSRPYRITLLENLAGDSAYEISRGVLEYKAHSPHWQLFGATRGTFLPYDEISAETTDGVIGWFDSVGTMQRLIDAGVAVVTTSPHMPSPDLPCVCEDLDAAGRLGAESLLELGFEQFGFFSAAGPAAFDTMASAFREVIAGDAGRPCHLFTMKWTNRRTERQDFMRWLQTQPKPIAIMAPDDRLARRVIEYAEELGLRVPDDVAVLGTGNDRWQCIIPAVPMSSVDTDRRQVGYHAASILDEQLRGGAPTSRQFVRPSGVVSRRSTDVRSSTDPLVGAALTFIREHATQRMALTDVADHVGVSRRTLQNRMKRATGLTPKQAIDRERLRAAKKLLAETNGTMQQIAFSCGFEEQAHFSRFFKNQTGERPGEYRLRVRR